MWFPFLPVVPFFHYLDDWIDNIELERAGGVAIGLYVLKPFADPPKPCDAGAHKITSPARYSVRLNMMNISIPTTRLVGVHQKLAWVKDPSSGIKARNAALELCG